MSLSWKRIVPGVGLTATLSILAMPNVAVAAPEDQASATSTVEAPAGQESSGENSSDAQSPDPSVEPPAPSVGNPTEQPSEEPLPTTPSPGPTDPHSEESPVVENPAEDQGNETPNQPGQPVEQPTNPVVDPSAEEEDPIEEPREDQSAPVGGGAVGDSLPGRPISHQPTSTELHEVSQEIENVVAKAPRGFRNTELAVAPTNVGNKVADILANAANQQQRRSTATQQQRRSNSSYNAPVQRAQVTNAPELAHTGASMEHQAALAAGLLAFGTGAIAASRRREA